MMVDGILAILTVPCLLLMLFGTMVGIVFGAVPGLSATMALALCLPISYKLPSTLSIAFLIALYIGGISGGLISAILLNIPGTPSSVATTFDGSPMAKNGQAGKALGIAMFSSLIGTLVSVVILMFLAPVIARAALKFGPYEYFSVCFFALVLLSVLISESAAKGLTAAVLGLIVSMVGVAPVGSAIRFTFGVKALNLGFQNLPVMVGMFAVADILANSCPRPSLDNAEIIQDYKFRGLGFKFSDLAGQAFNYIRSIVIGIAIGVLPGVGGATSNVIAYSVAKQTSKKPEKFGTGCVDGIVASEASNNACIGGAMIPLLTLGIPGDGPTAILLGGLTIAGISPGPLLFQNNASFVYSVYTALILCTIMMFVLELFGMRLFIRILKVPKYYLYPIIMALCTAGIFASNNQIFDVWSVVIFGVIGFLMKRYRFPTSPFILGFLLGGIMETYLIRSLQYSKGDVIGAFAVRPISMFFLSATVLAVAFVTVSRIRKARRQKI